MAAKNVYFYNSRNGDRKYSADSMMDWLKPFFTTGVFNGCFRVVANGNMTVTIDGGHANIGGRVINQTEPETLDIEVASGTLNRIDNVVLRRDDVKRDIYLLIQTGGYANNPVAPELIRHDGIYDIKLAEIRVNAGVMAVKQSDIKDTRMDGKLCGWVASTVKEIDFSNVVQQFGELYEQFTNDFFNWFDGVRNILDDNTAGSLLNLIQALDAGTVKKADKATTDEVTTGTNDTKYVTPLGVKEALQTGSISKRFASITIGLESAGYTAADVDMLIAKNSDPHSVIYNAMRALTATGGEIVLLEGNYPLTATLVCDVKNVVLRGMGTATRLYRAGAFTPMINITADAANMQLVALNVDGMWASYPGRADKNIVCSAAGFRVRNCLIQNSSSHCMELTAQGRDAKIIECTIYSTDASGIHIQGNNSTQYELMINDCVISGCAQYGIYARGIYSGSIQINHVHFINCDTGCIFPRCQLTVVACVFFACTTKAIHVTSDGGSGNGNINILGNKINNSTIAIFVEGTYNGASIANNYIFMSHSGGDGISVSSTNCVNGSITGNAIRGSFRYGIEVKGPRWIIGGNNTNGGVTGAIFSASAGNCSITGNNFLNNSSTGISIATNYNAISGNNLSGSENGLLITTGYYNAVTGNIYNSVSNSSTSNILNNNIATAVIV